MILIIIAITVALFFSLNIGASGAAASMGAAYGGGAISKRLALLVVAIGIIAGAVLGGGEVVKTIGSGIVPPAKLTVEVVVITLLSATMTLFIANLLGIPLSTSEVTIGSIVGIGIAYQSLYVHKVLYIVSFWIMVPLVAYLTAFLLGRLVKYAENRWPVLKGQGKWRYWLSLLLILTGFLEAFSAGMNNVANAVGPLVGAGLMKIESGVWIGGLFVALGALLLGGRVLETNGKKITKMSLLQGSVVSATGGTLVIMASIFGIPVPLTQATTCAILGVGSTNNGFSLRQKGVIKQIMLVWIVSPVTSLVVSFGLVHAVLEPNPYMVAIVGSVFIATAGLIYLYRIIKKEKAAFHDQGGGI